MIYLKNTRKRIKKGAGAQLDSTTSGNTTKFLTNIVSSTSHNNASAVAFYNSAEGTVLNIFMGRAYAQQGTRLQYLELTPAGQRDGVAREKPFFEVLGGNNSRDTVNLFNQYWTFTNDIAKQINIDRGPTAALEYIFQRELTPRERYLIIAKLVESVNGRELSVFYNSNKNSPKIDSIQKIRREIKKFPKGRGKLKKLLLPYIETNEEKLDPENNLAVLTRFYNTLEEHTIKTHENFITIIKDALINVKSWLRTRQSLPDPDAAQVGINSIIEQTINAPSFRSLKMRERDKAITKIQAITRGRKTRKGTKSMSRARQDIIDRENQLYRRKRKTIRLKKPSPFRTLPARPYTIG